MASIMDSCKKCPEYKRAQDYLQATLGTDLFGPDGIRALTGQLADCVIASKDCPGPIETRVSIPQGRIFIRNTVYTLRTCPSTNSDNPAVSWDRA